jgi:hypothetical protein
MTDGAGASGAAITSSISLRSIDQDAHAAHQQQPGRSAAAREVGLRWDAVGEAEGDAGFKRRRKTGGRDGMGDLPY